MELNLLFVFIGSIMGIVIIEIGSYLLKMRTKQMEKQKALKKLEELEVLEDQIGLSLLELFDYILGKDVYYLDDNDYFYEFTTGIKLVTINKTLLACTAVIPNRYDYVITTDSCWTFSLKDLGKTWFLTEEEAEKKLEELKKGVGYEL